MHVLHLIATVGKSSGGLGPVALNLAQQQKALGCQVSLWCLNYRDDATVVASLHELEDCLTVWPVSGPSMLGYSQAMHRALKTEGSHFDLIHQHSIWQAYSYSVSTWKARFNRPTVIVPHGTLDDYARRRSRVKKMVASLLYESRNLHSATCLHALSEMEVSTFRDYGLNNPIAVLPNGISETWLQSAGCRESFIDRLSLPADRRVLLFLSRIHPIKGLPLLLNAMSQIRHHLADWTLVIAGPDENGHQREIEALVRRLDIAEYVRFVGPLHGQDKRNVFAAADLFILPTHSEGAPIVVLEALGAGVPVLTTCGTPWEELITHRCGWWVSTNESSIREALLEAIRLPRGELEAMGQRGRKLVLERYTWSEIAQKSIRLYTWLLGAAEQPDFVVMG